MTQYNDIIVVKEFGGDDKMAQKGKGKFKFMKNDY